MSDSYTQSVSDHCFASQTCGAGVPQKRTRLLLEFYVWNFVSALAEQNPDESATIKFCNRLLINIRLCGLKLVTYGSTRCNILLLCWTVCVTSLRLENDWFALFNKWQLVGWNSTHLYFVQLRSTTFNMLNGLFQHSTLHDTLILPSPCTAFSHALTVNSFRWRIRGERTTWSETDWDEKQREA